jgi:TetR/AcrR family transcriptional regulator, transcriptional repressor for nem operon
VRYPPEETAEKHERILEVATRMFRDRGFSGVNISELMKAAGLTHGSFYNHFESKQTLASECVLHAASQSLTKMDRYPTTETGHRNYIRAYLSVAHRDDPGNGCLMAALASEVSREQPAKKSMTRHVELFVDKLSSHFPWPGKRAKRAKRAEAIRMTASLVGAVILSRAVEDEAFSREILNEVLSELLGRAGGEEQRAA